MIFRARPNRLYTLSMYSWAVSIAVIVFVHGANTSVLVQSWSTITHMLSYSFDFGRSVMKSIFMVANG